MVKIIKSNARRTIKKYLTTDDNWIQFSIDLQQAFKDVNRGLPVKWCCNPSLAAVKHFINLCIKYGVNI